MIGHLYRINFSNGKSYIGITSTSMQRRISLHRSHAKKEVRGALQRAIRKYGGFQCEVLVTASSWEYLCDLEKRAIAAFGTFSPGGYNVTLGGEGGTGVKWSPEARARMSEIKKGQRLGIAPRPPGWKHSDEAKEKIAAAGRGRVFSDERKAKIGATKVGNKYNVGRVVTEETKRRIAKNQIGVPKAEETRRKMSEAKNGKPWTAARRAALESRR